MKQNKPLAYIATPYSHEDPQVSHARYLKATRLAGLLMAEGVTVFSPISHCHHIAEMVDLPTSWAFWKQIDTDFLSVSGCLIVMCVDGWKESTGVTAEIAIANEQDIPVVYLFGEEIDNPNESLIKDIKAIFED